jgi:hypothetical protein
MHSLYHNRYRHEIDYRKKDAATKATSHIFFLSIIPLNYIWSPQLSQKYCTIIPSTELLTVADTEMVSPHPALVHGVMQVHET